MAAVAESCHVRLGPVTFSEPDSAAVAELGDDDTEAEELPLWNDLQYFIRNDIAGFPTREHPGLGIYGPGDQLRERGTKALDVSILAIRRPIARIHLATRSARRECASLRSAFALSSRRYNVEKNGSDLVLPDCRDCGLPAASWCEECGVPLCHLCENEFDYCLECNEDGVW